MKMFINAEEKRMYGKVWYDGDPEPQEWTIEDDYTTFGAERFPTPFVGLCANAGTAAGGLSASSYDDFYVFDDGGLVPNAVEPGNKLATTWSEIRKSH
jgi:hypothetical protein